MRGETQKKIMCFSEQNWRWGVNQRYWGWDEIPNETKRYASSSDEAHETYTKIHIQS